MTLLRLCLVLVAAGAMIGWRLLSPGAASADVERQVAGPQASTQMASPLQNGGERQVAAEAEDAEPEEPEPDLAVRSFDEIYA
ncbi:hypothetical protein N9F93_00445, partial [bacterium]|nr:hypothetical protein [bacterium]